MHVYGAATGEGVLVVKGVKDSRFDFAAGFGAHHHRGSLRALSWMLEYVLPEVQMPLPCCRTASWQGKHENANFWHVLRI